MLKHYVTIAIRSILKKKLFAAINIVAAMEMEAMRKLNLRL